MKEEVIIEEYDGSSAKVSIMPYDRDNVVAGTPYEVISRKEAFSKYEVVGELIEGELRLFEEEDDYEYTEEDIYDSEYWDDKDEEFY